MKKELEIAKEGADVGEKIGDQYAELQLKISEIWRETHTGGPYLLNNSEILAFIAELQTRAEATETQLDRILEKLGSKRQDESIADAAIRTIDSLQDEAALHSTNWEVGCQQVRELENLLMVAEQRADAAEALSKAMIDTLEQRLITAEDRADEYAERAERLREALVGHIEDHHNHSKFEYIDKNTDDFGCFLCDELQAILRDAALGQGGSDD